jgi:acyl-CoA thioesterase
MALTKNARLTRTTENSYAGQSDPGYWNLIGPFGGWIAALLLRAVLDDPRHLGEPLSMSIDFAGPMEAGAFVIRVRELRHNRSTTFWWTELVQQQGEAEVVCAFATIVTAKRRETPSFLESAPPSAEPPEGLKSFAPLRSPLPFFERFDMRYATNPLVPEEDGERLLWVKVRDAGVLDFETLTALCDIGLPHVFARLKKRVPVSSVTMNVFFHAVSDDLTAVGEDFVLSASHMRIIRLGFFDATTTMWSRSGALLATTEQVVWFKSPE